MNNNFYIIIIDDSLKSNAPLVARMKKMCCKENVLLIREVDKAIEFIMSHLDDRMIIFMDCKFNNGQSQGVDGLIKIRERTSLISIIMMSANSLNQMSNAEIKEMINAENIYFIDNDDMHGAEKCVKEIRERWISSLDCILEQWVLSHDGVTRSKPYMKTEKGVMSLADILSEIRKRTPIGIDIENGILQYAITRLTEDIKNNQDA